MTSILYQMYNMVQMLCYSQDYVVWSAFVMSLSSALGAVIAYFVVGGIYMYRIKGARGMEVIPNYAFWKDLPFLIKVMYIV